MTARALRTSALLASVALGAVSLGGCSGVPSGAGGGLPAEVVAAPASGASSGSTTGPAHPGSGHPPSGCPAGADYCVTFANSAPGWLQTTQADYYLTHDSAYGGSYRMGERTARTVTSDAPLRLGQLAPRTSVRVDVDTVLGAGTPPGGQAGITCWEHRSADGRSTAGYAVYVGPTRADVALWDAASGAETILRSVPLDHTVRPGVPVHLQAVCRSPGTGSPATAAVELSVDGAPVISVSDGPFAASFAGAGVTVGLLASGAGTDVYYRNFAIRGF